jgi:hypothetical protein
MTSWLPLTCLFKAVVQDLAKGAQVGLKEHRFMRAGHEANIDSALG